MANNAVSMLFSNGILEPSQKSTIRTPARGAPSFMDILSERMQADGCRKFERRPLKKAGELPVRENKIKNQGETMPVASETKETGKSEANESTPVGANYENLDRVDREDSGRKNRESMIVLELMIALLEEFLARPDVKPVMDEHIETKSAMEMALIPADTESISPIELLKVILEDDEEKLRALMEKMGEMGQLSEILEFPDELRELVQKISAQQGGKVLIETIFKTDTEKNPVKDLVEQLRTQCKDLIDKLREQVSVVKDKPEGEPEILAEAVRPESLQQNSTEYSDHTHDSITAGKKEEDRVDKVTKDVNKPPNESDTEAIGKESFPEWPDSSHNMAEQTIRYTRENVGRIPERPVFTLLEKPSAQFVTNQIAMKVRLMAGENRQEMEMHLKPESLGRLSLKIIHERGEILARITTENEQVKSVLESNMQLLKDALEKNGLLVQSLSVSVGNGNGGRQSEHDWSKNGKSESERPAESGMLSPSSENLNSAEHKVRDFYYRDSSIDLIA